MIDVLQKVTGKFIILHAGREVAKDFDTKENAWSWADGNIDDQVFDTPNKLSAPLEYRTPLPTLEPQ